MKRHSACGIRIPSMIASLLVALLGSMGPAVVPQLVMVVTVSLS